MRILLIAGHGAGDPGATARFGLTTYKEATETRTVVSLLVTKLKKAGIEVDTYGTTRNAYTDYKNGTLLSRAQFHKYDYVLEIHFNACAKDYGNGVTKGVECYVCTTESGVTVEETICKNIAAIGFKNRGVKKKNFSVISKAKSSGVSSALLEVCFIDDYDDVKLYAKNRDKVAEAIARGIVSGFGLTTSKPREINLQQYGAAFTNIERLAYVPMTGTSGETVSSAAKRVKWNGRYPDAIINAELFVNGTYRASSGVVGQGINHNLTNTIGFAFVDNKKPVLSYKNNVNAPDWIGSYPVLLRDGKIAFTSIPAGLDGKRGRSAIAINDTHFAMFYVKEADGCTLDEFANAILARGFHTAINLDGGGSTACITPGVAYDQGRKVRGKVAMWIKGGSGNKLTK